jgi:lipopolysaccharide/colanic/teichoic acid biosynthesis glycosyltransferase
MKRLFDFLAASLALLLLALPLLALAWLIRRKLGSPVLFLQERAGLNGQPFTMVKFRSLTDERGPDGTLLPDAQRLTPFGRFLRRTSLDELPELWNVLRGEMSLVGPRPLVMDYLPLYNAEQAQRHDVKPGITGLAQVNGRNKLSWEEKFNLDIWYVNNHNIWLDMKIIFKTFIIVFEKRGVSPQNQEIMERFLGTRKSESIRNDGNKK